LSCDGRRKFPERTRRAAQRVLPGSFFDELAVPHEAHGKSCEIVDERWNHHWFNRLRLANDQRRMQPVRGHEIGRLIGPTRKHAVDDFETKRQPLDRFRAPLRAQPLQRRAGL
jgi:hypothetical protein